MKFIVLASTAMLVTLISLSLYIFSLDSDIKQCGGSLGLLSELKLADTVVDNDVLKTRIGLQQNYQALAAGSQRTRKALEGLTRNARSDAELAGLVAGLARDYRTKEALLADFREQNTLLSRSMTYFSQESGRQILSAGDIHTVRAIGALSSAVHRLCLDSSPAMLEEVKARFATVAQTKAASPLLTHARTLAWLLPETHATILQMRPLPQTPSFASVQGYLERRQDTLMRRSLQARSGLLLLSIVMLTTLLYLAKLLHERARALRRRSEFDRMMMAISRDVISPDRSKIDEVIRDHLQQLSHWLGKSRAGLAQVLANGQTQLWPDADDTGLRAAIAAIAAQAPACGARSHDLLVVRWDASVAALAQGDYGTLREAQWVCLRRCAESGTSTLLCFQYPRLGQLSDHFGELTLLNSALDTLAEALERQRLEDEAQTLERRLDRARRMEAVGTMACGISHNFNNIIGAIRGNVEAASLRLAPRIAAQSHLSQISRALDHAGDLVEAILDFGRAQNYNMRSVELSALLTQTVSMLSASLPRSVILDVRQHEPPLHAWGNPAQLQQVILNLATNAAQAMAMNGTVSIRLSAAGAGEGARTPTLARLEIGDGGVGIPAHRLNRIFDPFFTTREGGTGLGLATVKQIVGNHDGRIDVVSQPGYGTTFTVELPLCDCPGGSAPAPRHETWLVLCDDAAALERLEDLLAALGHEPIGFADSASAAQAIAAQPERFDGVLVQLEQRGDAAASVHALHGATPGRPTILATRLDALSPGCGLECAIAEIIAVPVDPSDLLQAMDRSRNGHRPASVLLHM